MWLVLIGAAILAIPFILAAHLRHATARLRTAPDAWNAAEKYARVLLEDRHLNLTAGDFVEFTLKNAGSGSMTRTFLRCLLLPWSVSSHEGSDGEKLLSSLNKEQEQNIYRFMVAAMLYDSLRTWVSGVFLRRVMYWMAAAVTDKTVPVSRAQVAPMVTATDRLCHSHAI